MTLKETTFSSSQEVVGQAKLKLITFNILAPCYKRLDGSCYESENEEAHISRCEAICNEIIKLDADIVNLQEYWFGSEKVLNIFRSKFQAAGYSATELRR